MPINTGMCSNAVKEDAVRPIVESMDPGFSSGEEGDEHYADMDKDAAEYVSILKQQGREAAEEAFWAKNPSVRPQPAEVPNDWCST